MSLGSIIEDYRKKRAKEKEEARKKEFLGKLKNPKYGEKPPNTRPPLR